MQTKNFLVNPQLEGAAFDWQAGRTGVLLIHGFTATTSEVRPLAKALHKHGYSVLGPLLPGHGTTPEDLNRCTWQDWTNAVDAAYRQLAQRCERVVIAGESMGGLLTLYAAIHHPEAAAVLTYAPALVTSSAWQKFQINLLSPLMPLLQKPQGQTSPADPLWQGYSVYPLRATAQMLRLQDIVRRDLALLRRPLLVVQGRLDTTVSPVVPDLIATGVSSTVKEVHWFEKSGHCVLLDVDMQAINDLTLQFLERVLN